MEISFIYTLPFFFTVLFLFKMYYSKRRNTMKLNPPPSPPKLPIIGNLHQIGPLIHRSLFSLSKQYGENLMLLHLGSVPALVVSSAKSAREIMQTHDSVFASRASSYPQKRLLYGFKEIAGAPYGEYWRQAKKTLILMMLNNKKVQTFSGLREQETANTINDIQNSIMSKKAVNLSDLFMAHSNAIFSIATYGKKYHDGESGKKFKRLMIDGLESVTKFFFVDFIPQLGWVDRITGARRIVENLAKNLDAFLDETIEERLAEIDSGKVYHDELSEDVEPVIDALLRLQNEGVGELTIDKEVIKALLMDSYIAGMETTGTMLEWVMVELLAHPTVLKKLQEEVRTIVNSNQHIHDDDVNKMKYLKAVILETSRLHPPQAIPFPRIAMEDVNVMGFDITKGTMVFINFWAIGRDPKVWDNPHEFVPERFIGSGENFVTHDFKLLAFGAGRRNCPGRGFAIAVVENLLANLLCKFDWALPDYLKNEGIDMSETVGLATRKKTPLFAFATPFCQQVHNIVT